MSMIDLAKICRTIETQRCKTHKERPTAVTVGESIKLTTCCDGFEKELEHQIEIEISKQFEEGLEF